MTANVTMIFCSWIDPLLWTGFKRPLTHSDIYAHPSEADSRHLLEKFNRFATSLIKIYNHLII